MRNAVGAIGAVVLAAGVLVAGAPGAARYKPGQACQAKHAAAYKKAGLRCVAGKLVAIAHAGGGASSSSGGAKSGGSGGSGGSGSGSGGSSSGGSGSGGGTTPTEKPKFALPGHYAGTTEQGKPISFDMQPDLKNLTNISAGEVVQTCNPAHAWTFVGFDTGGFDYPVSQAGIFHLPSGAGSHGTTGGANSIEWKTKIQLSAQWRNGGKDAYGDYHVTTTFTDGGVAYTCDTTVSWTAAHA